MFLDVFLAAGPKDILSLDHVNVLYFICFRELLLILLYFTVLRRHSLVLAFVSSLIGAMLFYNYYYYLCNVNTMSYYWREHVAITLIKSLLVLSFRGNYTKILCKINQKERVHLCPNLFRGGQGKSLFQNCI